MAVLRLELRASHALGLVLALLHGIGALCVVAIVPGYAGGALAVLLLALGGTVIWDRALLRARASVHALELAGDAMATLQLADGDRVTVHVGPRRHVSPWWVSLPLQGAARRNLVVVRDMLPPAEFRGLRLWAMWGRVPGASRLRHAS